MTDPIESILWSEYVPEPQDEEEEYSAADYADDYGDEPGID
jgi:hypothetical protein